MRRRRPRLGDKWHMDEVFIRIQGIQHYLWRAVDQDGIVLDILVQPRRNAKAVDVPPDFGPPGWRISSGIAQAGSDRSEQIISSIGAFWPSAL
jgi:hypothetical protein